MTSPLKGALARAATAPLAAAALTVGLLAAAPTAQAAPRHDATSDAAAFAQATKNETKAENKKKRQSTTVVLRRSRAMAALNAARTRTGSAYVYGGTGPRAFDCSGLTGWAYRAVGKNLPRTSGAQAAATKRISRGQARPGDLVFFHSGGRVYHVGLYAGGNSVFHASRPGTPVGTGPIWTSSVFFGRVR